MGHKNILFLTLKVFSSTGGIEKVNKLVGKMLYEWTLINNLKAHIHSAYDDSVACQSNKYFPSDMFTCFNKNKISFAVNSIRKSKKYNVILVSHVNLMIVAWLIKLFHPQKKIILIAHGIEIWSKVGFVKRKFLASANMILSVSHFTQKMVENHFSRGHHVLLRVLNNCLDPFLPIAKKTVSHQGIRNKYGYNSDDQILFTLTRLCSTERYKGYDRVIRSIAALKTRFPRLKYLIAGLYDKSEKEYLDRLIGDLGVCENVKMIGYVPDEDLNEIFSISDVYVMPSMKEGFGIVFIEAMFYGLPVIAGNRDGSVDALAGGNLGTLVDPVDQSELNNSIGRIIQNRSAFLPDKIKLVEEFSYENYKNKFEDILKSLFLSDVKINNLA